MFWNGGKSSSLRNLSPINRKHEMFWNNEDMDYFINAMH